MFVRLHLSVQIVLIIILASVDDSMVLVGEGRLEDIFLNLMEAIWRVFLASVPLDQLT
jgi:hypothetical protein